MYACHDALVCMCACTFVCALIDAYLNINSYWLEKLKIYNKYSNLPNCQVQQNFVKGIYADMKLQVFTFCSLQSW